MNDAMFSIVQGVDKLYPHNLENRFPRILDKLVELWDTPKFDAYLSDLMFSSRPDRQGFPKEIVSELHLLSQVRERTRLKPKTNNTNEFDWSDIEFTQQRVIESAGYECSFKGFLGSAESGNRAILEAFLRGGAKVNARDDRGWTALMNAAFYNQKETAQLLIANGANVQVKDKSGYAPLHWAAFNGHTELVNLLINYLANVNAQSTFGWTPLLQASTRGHAGTCAALIAGGADVNLGSKDGWTALHKACANGHSEVVKLLLAAGAKSDIPHQDGATPLSLALKNNHQAVAALL